MCKALSKSVGLLGLARDLGGRMLKHRAAGKSRAGGLCMTASSPGSLEATRRPRNWDDRVEAE